MSNDIVSRHFALPAMSDHEIGLVENLAEASLAFEQKKVLTYHVLHGGIYTRTILIEADTTLTGVKIKIPTTLVLSGHAKVFNGSEVVELVGHHVIPASAGRQQAFEAIGDTWLSMSFPTDATTIEDAEAQFTDTPERLLSRQQPDMNRIIITGE